MSALLLLLLSLAPNQLEKAAECGEFDCTTSEITWNGNGLSEEIVWPKSHVNSSHSNPRRKRCSS